MDLVDPTRRKDTTFNDSTIACRIHLLTSLFIFCIFAVDAQLVDKKRSLRETRASQPYRKSKSAHPSNIAEASEIAEQSKFSYHEPMVEQAFLRLLLAREPEKYSFALLRLIFVNAIGKEKTNNFFLLFWHCWWP